MKIKLVLIGLLSLLNITQSYATKYEAYCIKIENIKFKNGLAPLGCSSCTYATTYITQEKTQDRINCNTCTQQMLNRYWNFVMQNPIPQNDDLFCSLRKTNNMGRTFTNTLFTANSGNKSFNLKDITLSAAYIWDGINTTAKKESYKPLVLPLAQK